MIPYGRQSIGEEDIESVVEVLKSDWLTTGPKIEEFEREFEEFTGAENAVAVANGTAALHTAMFLANIKQGDEVIVPPMTFAATSNSVLFQGGTPVFVDIDTDTLLIDHEQVVDSISEKTKAIVCVDYAGQPCAYDELGAVAEEHDVLLIADSCHALGAEYKGKKVGTLADITVFSFHPVKHITTGEGGMVVTDDDEFARRARRFRNHGIDKDVHKRKEENSWYYEMVDLGYNYRITDIQCALGITQLKKLPGWLKRRREIAERYDRGFSQSEHITPLKTRSVVSHAYHLYVVKIDEEAPLSRDEVFDQMRGRDIGVNVHYIPVHLHPYYRDNLNTRRGMCPDAERVYDQILTLPDYPAMEDTEVEYVISSLREILGE